MPRNVRKGVSYAPQGLELEEKNEKSKIRGGSICAPRAKHGIVPNLS